jgi:RimJ/RimL family protein N-acetyltransferase
MDPLAGIPVQETTLETERLLLEPLLPEHATLLIEGLADERLYRFIPTDAPESTEALETRYRKLSSRRSPDGSEVWLNFAMPLREGTTPEDGAVPRATHVGTLEATVFPDRSAYIAYTVFVPSWHHGYAREGCACWGTWSRTTGCGSLWQRWTHATPLRSHWQRRWASTGSAQLWAQTTSRAR